MVARLEIHKTEATKDPLTDIVDDMPSNIIANPMVSAEV